MEIIFDSVMDLIIGIGGLIVGVTTISAFLWRYFIKPGVIREIKNNTRCDEMSSFMKNKAEKIEIDELKEKISDSNEAIKEIARAQSASVGAIHRSIEADKHILQGVFACLDGLKQLGSNGRVSASYDDMRTYLIDRENSDVEEKDNV